ncbi:sensor histidine kinase [Cryobacterium sp. SO2]|uniref:sensor histidine kinase n=1 Tax=Cryobacterium sp. SO2 TaxID=1897060 RepID=UPI00223D8DEA|nr:sensor histidine kinase [Cryobacterium sp. SO2]WEO77765.1 sensor histidine kinase [Cryobacterium sp. SO2]
MNARRWWDLIIAGSLIVLAAIALEGSATHAASTTGAVLSLAAVGLAYIVWGRRMLRPQPVSGDRGSSGFDHVTYARSARALRIALIVGCGVATSFDPNMATLQTLVFPLIWALADSCRHATVLSTSLTVVSGLGLWIGSGRTPDAAAQAVAIETISLVFALAMGTWITRIATAGAEQRRLVEKLTLAQDELALMHRDAGSASERERLAREIHDTIAQSLTSLVMLAQRTRRELDSLPVDTSDAADSVDLIEATGRDALAEARALVASMAPARVGDGDLTHTLTRLAERFERETGILVRVHLDGLGNADDNTVPVLDRALEVVLLRCTQEGLANVRKHSRAGAARIDIERTGPDIVLTVSDNGRGLGDYTPDTEHGFGLAGMRDRLALVGGSLEVATGAAPSRTDRIAVGETPSGTDPIAGVVTKGAADCGTGGHGTTLRVTLPLSGPTVAATTALPAVAGVRE